VCGSTSRFACKLRPDRNEELRDRYDAVTPAFHWNKKHWSYVYYELLDTDLVTALITESYRLIVSKLPKAVRVKYE
jgi:predicted DNA-binding protein (MmcQ/YjbR family)